MVRTTRMTPTGLALSAAADASPPAGLTAAARTLWFAKAGQWDAAHDLCQDIPGSAGSWLHAYLHRDLGSYFLQFSLGCLRKDRDGWETSSKLIGDRIRAARNTLGLTQCQLAERLLVAEGTLAAWEANYHQPSGRKALKLTEMFGAQLLASQ